MKRILTAALFAAAMAAPALADDQATANERCVAMATEQAVASLPPETPDDQKAMMTTLITDVCGCLFQTRSLRLPAHDMRHAQATPPFGETHARLNSEFPGHGAPAHAEIVCPAVNIKIERWGFGKIPTQPL